MVLATVIVLSTLDCVVLYRLLFSMSTDCSLVEMVFPEPLDAEIVKYLTIRRGNTTADNSVL